MALTLPPDLAPGAVAALRDHPDAAAARRFRALVRRGQPWDPLSPRRFLALTRRYGVEIEGPAYLETLSCGFRGAGRPWRLMRTWLRLVWAYLGMRVQPHPQVIYASDRQLLVIEAPIG